MDIRHFVQDWFLVFFFINFCPGLSISMEDDYEDGPSFGRCPWIRNKLKNGRVRYRYKGRVAKFLCDSGYDLAGKRSSTCVRGQWSNPIPVCVARGCNRVPSIPNGHVTEMYRGALLVYDCNPGYSLDGVASIHCDGRRWSTSPPICVVATETPYVSCDFESPDLCGWSHDPNHDFDWKRNQFSTPSGHVGTGPSFDHTFGENKGGYYLYIEASSPRKVNDTARLFSPVYSAGLSGGCFLFWYHMYGATTGGLRVYLKPESHVFDELLPKWEKFGNQGNKWNRGNIAIPVLNENFQIVIEGIRGESYVGDSAIDDVSLTSYDCDSMENDTGIVEHTIDNSCRGRCREADSDSSCSCIDDCYAAHNCCNDYVTFCFNGNETTVQNADEMPPEDFTTKASSAPLTATATTAKTTEQQTSIVSTKASSESTQMSSVLTSSTILQTSPSVDSSISTTSSSAASFMPTSTIYTRGLTNASLPYVSTLSSASVQTKSDTSTSTESVKPSSTLSSSILPKTDVASSITSVETTTGSKTSVRTTSGPTTSRPTTSIGTTYRPTTTIGTTTTSSTTSERATISSTTPLKTTTASTTSATTTTTTATTTTSMETTTPSTTITTTFTSLIPASAFSASLPRSTLPNTTTAVKSTFTSSNIMPATSSVTTESTTRRTYNLRPRTRTTIPVSSVTYESSTRESVAQKVTDTTVVSIRNSTTSKAPLTDDRSTFSTVKSSTTDLTTWHDIPVTPTYAVASTRFRAPTTTLATTKATPKTLTSTQYIKRTTIRYTPQVFRLTSTQSSSPSPTTSDSYETGSSKAETAASNGSIPIVISLLSVIICIAGGVAYYLRRQRNKRQSKLSDDSEMRFLQENEYMEYSDASTLDRILVK